jgi:hypothetical protein
MRIISVTGVRALSVIATLGWASTGFAQTTTTTSDEQGTSTTTTTSPVPPPTGALTPQTVTVQPVVPAPPVTTTSAPVVLQPSTHETVVSGEKVPNMYLIWTGVFLMGAPYLASAIVSAESSHQGDSHLWVPLAGPWMDFGDRGAMPSGNGRDAEVASRVFLALDGVFQAVGTLEIIGGFVFPATRYERKTTNTTTETGAFKPTVHVAPIRFDGSGYGLGALGTF